EWQPVDVAADDLEKAAGFAVEHDVLGDPVTDLRAPVAQPVGHLIDTLIKLDRDIETFIGEHAAMLRDPDRQVEIVSRDRGEDQLPHFTCAVSQPTSQSATCRLFLSCISICELPRMPTDGAPRLPPRHRRSWQQWQTPCSPQ